MKTGGSELVLDLSVVVIVLEGKVGLEKCLKSLCPQIERGGGEILVPFDERFPDIVECQKGFPDVTFLPLNGVRTFAELRAIGVGTSRGRVVAITEDQCRPASNWCREILKAHRECHVAVGGVVEKEIPDAAINWAFFFADYLRYMSPIPGGPVHHLTDCNVSYKRETLEKIRNIWALEFHEPEVHQALEQEGQSLWLTPEVRVFQHRNMSMRSAVKDRFGFGRLFGSGRVTGASFPKRMLASAIAVATPPLTIGRLAKQVQEKGRFKNEFWKALPYIALFNTLWAIGEGVGCFTGRPPEWLKPPNEAELNIPPVHSKHHS